jgi:hypothetical protein
MTYNRMRYLERELEDQKKSFRKELEFAENALYKLAWSLQGEKRQEALKASVRISDFMHEYEEEE